MRAGWRRLASVLLLPGLGCVGSAGGDTVDFPLAAAGPSDATAGQPLAFSSGDWDVVLTQARLHIGAVYLNQSAPASGGQATGCYLTSTGIYLAQETAALDVDLLSPALQPFPALAHGITSPPSMIGQVWLTGGDVNTIVDTTPILIIVGSATRAETTFPFTGTITIGANRASSNAGGAAGGDPICKQRIVTPIPAALTILPTGGLELRIDPRLYFVNVDFSQLTLDTSSGAYVFSDQPSSPGYTAPSLNLFYNLGSTAPYGFSWNDGL